MKTIRRLKRRKGFTLTELIVVVAIIAILMASVAAFSQPVRMMVTGTNARSDAVTINEIIGNYLERRLSYSETLAIYVGYDYSTSGDLETAFEAYQNKYVKDKAQPGMLVLHYNGNDERFKKINAGEPYKASFVLYDQPLDKTSTMLNLNVGKDDDDETDDLRNYKVFADEFYAGYQYFITTDETLPIRVNNLTHEAYFSTKIISYNIDDPSVSMSDDKIKSYYDGDTSGIDGLINFRTGVEEVSFSLANITSERDTNGLYKNTIDKVSMSRKTEGTDIIIFYNIKNYSSLDLKN